MRTLEANITEPRSLAWEPLSSAAMSWLVAIAAGYSGSHILGRGVVFDRTCPLPKGNVNRGW